MNNDLQFTKCPICSIEGNIKILYKNLIGNKSILECPKCSIQYLYPYPTESELNEIYSEGYAAWGIGNEDTFSEMKKAKFRKLLKYTAKYCNKGNLLDFGCGPGYLMEEAKKIGFNVYGAEFGEYAANISKNKFGEDRIFAGNIENCKFQDNFFDIVIMSDLLEHIVNPVSSLKKVNAILKNTVNSNGGGYCMITTPNTNSFTCKIMGSKWAHYNLEHIHYFNINSIKKVAKITGFEILEIKPYFKILTIKYMNYIFKYNKRKFLSFIFSILEKIPILCNLQIPILAGEFLIILRKKGEII